MWYGWRSDHVDPTQRSRRVDADVDGLIKNMDGPDATGPRTARVGYVAACATLQTPEPSRSPRNRTRRRASGPRRSSYSAAWGATRPTRPGP
jgi:hypothetical protein